jgi:hypothetical protein
MPAPLSAAVIITNALERVNTQLTVISVNWDS